MNENIFDKLDFGPFRSLLDNDDITDISYDNNGQIWIRSLTQGSMRVEIEGATPEFVEKLAFQCSNVMGTTFNNAKPFLDAESSELRMNFVHQSIATNGIALVIRKTPAKIRLEKEKLIKEDYFTPAIHDLLIKCVLGHCNIMVAGETGSGKTEFVKYLASHTATNEKIITIEDTLELHLDKIFPERDIVAMKTNNVASYTDVLVTCMRQNPKWILLSEVRSAEAVSAVRNSISSGHNILSTIHADKASAIPYRLYSLMETDLDVNQFLNTIYRYIQIGVHIRAFYSKEYGQFHREVDEVCEFYVDENNEPVSRIIYQKQFGKIMMCKPSKHLVEYIENQNMSIQDIIKDLPDDLPLTEVSDDDSSTTESSDSGVQAVNNDGLPGAKMEEESPVVPSADLGHEESIPSITNDGNVPLSSPAVLPLGGLLAQNVGSDAYVNATLVSGAESQVPVQQSYGVQQQMMPQQTQYYQTPQVMPQQAAYGSVPQMTQTMQYTQAQQPMQNTQQVAVQMPTQQVDMTKQNVPQQQMAYNSVPQMVSGTVDTPVINTGLPTGDVPVMNNSVSPAAETPVLTDNSAAVSTPVIENSVPTDNGAVMTSVLTTGEVPVMDNSAVVSTPVIDNSVSTDNVVSTGDTPILTDSNAVVNTPVIDNSVAPTGEVPVMDNSAVVSTPVIDNSVSTDNVVSTGDTPILTDSNVVVNTPAVDNSVIPVPTTENASLGGADTVIPIVQEPSQDTTPLPLDSNPATGGAVIPNIIKLDQ